MSKYLVSSAQINDLAHYLQKSYSLYGPQTNAQTGQVFFDKIDDLSVLDLEAEIPSMPIKEVLFPQMEKIQKHHYNSESKAVRVEKLYHEKAKALFGVRSCDLNGILCTDRFFMGGDFVDEVYLTHRKKCFIVSNTCPKAFDQCFCVCMDTGPSADEGFDLDLTKINKNQYLLRVGSPKGEEVVHALGFALASEENIKARNTVIDKSIASFPKLAKDNKAWTSRVMNRITTGFIKHEIWEYIGSQCVECGACSFVCPTCTCFNIEDSTTCDGCESTTERLRTRDSCSFEGYARMAGDHNPRAPVEDRRNKRFFCKLSYSQSKKYLRPGCVGCGRCQWVCPGDIGLPNVVEYIRREVTEFNN